MYSPALHRVVTELNKLGWLVIDSLIAKNILSFYVQLLTL